MKRYKIYIAAGIAIIVAGYFIFSHYYLGNPRLILENISKTDIDSIEVIVSGNTYFIKKLASESKKTIRVNPLWDSDVKLKTQNGKNEITIDTYLDRASTGGYIKAQITKDSLISFEHKRGLL